MRTQWVVGLVLGAGLAGLGVWRTLGPPPPAPEAPPPAVSAPAPSAVPVGSPETPAPDPQVEARRLATALEAEIDEPLGGPVPPGEETPATASLRVDRIIEILEESYDDPSDEALVRRKLARDLLVALGERAVDPLLEQARDADDTFRMEIQSIFGEIGPVAVPRLTEALQNPDEGVRKEAGSALGVLGDAAVPAVRALLQAANQAGRNLELGGTVLVAAAQVGRGAVPTLTTMLDDPDPGLRFFAAWVLGRIGPEAVDSVGALEGLLEREENESIRFITSRALEQIEPGS